MAKKSKDKVVCIAEAIYTYDEAEQEFKLIEIPVSPDGTLSEAEVLLTALKKASKKHRYELVKISFCFSFPEDVCPRCAAPWLFRPDSPLFRGKLYLMQHKWGDPLVEDNKEEQPAEQPAG
jgi:hypothetical protein